MDNETKQMFELLINKIDNLSDSVNGMDKRLDGMDTRLDSMETRLDNMDTRLDRMEIRQNEIFSVVKAIEHSNTTHKAEIDNINHKLAHTEGVINKVGNVIIESRAVK